MAGNSHKNIETEWHMLSEDEAVSKLDSSIEGISNEEAHERLKKFGHNRLPLQKVLSLPKK